MENIIIFMIIILLLIVLSFGIVKWYEKRVDRITSQPKSAADYFSDKRWAYTATQLGLIKKYTDPAPSVNYEAEGTDSALLTIIPRRGDDIAPYTRLSERLRTFTGAVQADYKIENNQVMYKLWYVLPEEDILDQPISWTPDVLKQGEVNLSHIPIGINRNERPLYIRANVHTLLIGATGAGKGSVIWSLIGALKDMKNVELWGVDLKGGVEFSLNTKMFKRMATDKESLVELVLELEEFMDRRMSGMAKNNVRKLKPTEKNKQIFLIVDEVNSIPRAASSLPPKESKAFMNAWDNILSKGRAPGISLFCAGQNPRGNKLPSRELFVQYICLKTGRKMDQSILFGDMESFKYADTSTWKGKDEAAGRGLIYDDDTGTYQEFKAYYPDDNTIKLWKKA